jgi:hypothetical protein
VRVTDAGNVGIGTGTTPSEDSDEPLRAGTNGYYFTVVANRGGGEYVDIGAYHLTQGRKDLVLNGAGPGSGKVGIGTTDPQCQFHVKTGDLVGRFESTGEQAYLQLMTNEGIDNRVEITNRPGGRLSLWTAGASDGGDGFNITRDGSVGIGTIRPNTRFHVRAPNAVGLFESMGEQAFLGLMTNEGIDNRVEITNRPGGRLSLFTVGGGDAFNITRDGNVGIGRIDPSARLSVSGDVEVTGDIRLLNADCAEDFDVAEAEDVEPGTVMVIDEEGAVKRSQQAYDKRVAGVVSGAGEYRSGIILDRRDGQAHRTSVALMGKVACKVDAQYSPIEVGDLLTTSPTPGHAMKADDPHRAFGSVIGKALRPLKGSRGIIPILAALQ